LLIAGALQVLIAAAPAMAALVGDGSLLAITALVVCAIAAGYALGGSSEHERSTLAIATAMRHPGIALAIASFNVPEAANVGAAVLLYVLASVVLTTVFGTFGKRRHSGRV
jgi:BASS family bile acid:Na+ symporter